MPVSMTPITTSAAALDLGSSPDEAERPRKEGDSVVCSCCVASGTTARTERWDARCAAWRSVSRAAKPVAACAYEESTRGAGREMPAGRLYARASRRGGDERGACSSATCTM